MRFKISRVHLPRERRRARREGCVRIGLYVRPGPACGARRGPCTGLRGPHLAAGHGGGVPRSGRVPAPGFPPSGLQGGRREGRELGDLDLAAAGRSWLHVGPPGLGGAQRQLAGGSAARSALRGPTRRRGRAAEQRPRLGGWRAERARGERPCPAPRRALRPALGPAGRLPPSSRPVSASPSPFLLLALPPPSSPGRVTEAFQTWAERERERASSRAAAISR